MSVAEGRASGFLPGTVSTREEGNHKRKLLQESLAYLRSSRVFTTQKTSGSAAPVLPIAPSRTEWAVRGIGDAIGS